MKPIIVIPNGVLSTKEKDALIKEGYLVIVTDEPGEIKFLSNNPQEEKEFLDKDMILECAVEALSWGNDSTCRNQFSTSIRKKIMDKYKIKQS